jgi:hypothetical protein
MSLTQQVVMDKKGNAVAVQIPISQYKKIMDQLEELDDIKSFDKAMKRKHEFLPFKEVVQRLKLKRKKKK